MADIEKARERLQAAKALFVERYRITPFDKSAGLDAINSILDQAQPNVGAMRSVMGRYNLYPTYEARINAVLDEADAALAGEEVPAVFLPEDDPVTPEPPAEPEPKPRGRRKTTEEPVSSDEGVIDGSDS